MQAAPAGACVTLSDIPAIVSDAVLIVATEFLATLTVTTLDPVFVGEESVIHEALLDQVHVQPAGAVTETVVTPPVAAKASVEDEMLGEHCVPVPDWLTVEFFAPTDSAPLRDVEELFDPTVNLAVPAPLPLAVAAGTVNQLALLVIVQLQPAAAATVAVPEPPAGPNDAGERVTV